VNKASSEILRHLDRHGVIDKDKDRPRAPHAQRKNISRGRRGGSRATVNLHGQTEEAAERTLRDWISQCRQTGIAELLVIHGRGLHSDPVGGGILRTLVRMMLENELSPFIRSFSVASPRDGGEGATLVRF
jgi:DNA-nicking Smr family endonuclease